MREKQNQLAISAESTVSTKQTARDKNTLRHKKTLCPKLKTKEKMGRQRILIKATKGKAFAEVFSEIFYRIKSEDS